MSEEWHRLRHGIFSKGAAIFAVAIVGYVSACSSLSSQGNSAALEKIGCNFDAKKICQSAMTGPTDFNSGIQTSNRSYGEQNSLATEWVQVPMKAPGGSEVDVQCQINTQDRRVVYAYAVPSGSVSESDRSYIRQSGLCIGEAGTQNAPPVRAEQ